MEENDPFGTFGPLLGAAGMMNPFGSLFGGFFGHGVDPWSDLEDGEEGDGRGGSRRNPSANPWAAMGGGSRSVSSSTRTTRDEKGKRITTTVTKTTTVDSEGNRKTETETTVRHLDEGGRVERSRIVEEDGNAAKTRRTGEEPKGTARSSGLAAAKRLAAQSVEGRGEARHGDDETATADEGPAEVTMIATDCIFGLSISDVPSSDPDMPQSTPSRQQGNKHKSESEAGWRQTEYTFRLGRFFPPFMVVGKYYDDPVEDERRRREGKREYDEMREGKRKSRWGKSAERLDDGPSRGDERSAGKKSDERLTAAASGTEYYLQRLYVQMNKNLDAMVNIGGAMMTPEFPGKVSWAGYPLSPWSQH